jgi:hypothetical protein
VKKNRFLAGISLLVAASLACNITAEGSPTDTPQAPTDTPSQSETATPEATPTTAITASPTVPMVSVTVATNCRSGPSTDFEIQWSLQPGEKAELVGKNTALNYWIVKIPGGQCWLWGQYATVEGNVAGLPEIPAPPLPATATPATPNPVTNLLFVGQCANQIFLGGDLSWEDKSEDEDGFRVYAGNTLLATLPPNTVMYQVTVVGPYGVEAFNAAGASIRKTVPTSCQ